MGREAVCLSLLMLPAVALRCVSAVAKVSVVTRVSFSQNPGMPEVGEDIMSQR